MSWLVNIMDLFVCKVFQLETFGVNMVRNASPLNSKFAEEGSTCCLRSFKNGLFIGAV